LADFRSRIDERGSVDLGHGSPFLGPGEQRRSYLIPSASHRGVDDARRGIMAILRDVSSSVCDSYFASLKS
jgi:hypothetical protein